MSENMTDVTKTLTLLKAAGKVGVHSFDLGDTIGTWRVAARVRDLKNMGYKINGIRERKGNAWGVRYILYGLPKEIQPEKLVFNKEKQIYEYYEEPRQGVLNI